MVIEVTGNHLISCLDNRLGYIRVQTEVQVSLSGTFLQQAESFDDGDGHSLTFTANLEILE